MHHEGLLLEIMIRFKADVHSSKIEGAIVENGVVLGEEWPALSLGGVVVTVQLATGDHECGWDLGDRPRGPCNGRE